LVSAEAPTIRPATAADIPEIFAIYDEQVLHGTATFDTVPKTAAERREWFEAHPPERYPILVAVDGDAVVGWARIYPWSPRRAYDRTAENSVYVHTDARGRRIGAALMLALMQRARDAGICVLVARIVEGNPASLRLHESLGFRSIGVMRRVGEKFGRLLDVRLMDLHLDLEPADRVV
jgi:L-amino acid N-acyltransferase